jgi:hypothetical protein
MSDVSLVGGAGLAVLVWRCWSGGAGVRDGYRHTEYRLESFMTIRAP